MILKVSNTLPSSPFTQIKVPVRFIQNGFTSQFSCSPSQPGKQTTEMQASQVESQTFLTLGQQSNLRTTILP